jgi:Cadherin-like beta sandwich domain
MKNKFSSLVSWIIPLALAKVLLLSSCQTADPPPAESILRLRLADSLSRYETVIVTLIDPLDTNLVLETVWSGPMPKPSQLSGYTLTTAKNRDFIVKIKGYSGGNQLFLQTLIYYVGGKKSVTHANVPPYKPRNRLKDIKPSRGILTPRFQPDSTNYSVNIPFGVDTVSLSLPTNFDQAKVAIDNELVNAGSNSMPIALTIKPHVVNIQVTDSSQGVAYTFEYFVILYPTRSGSGNLASLVLSTGDLEPPFSPNFGTYSLYLKDTVKTISFTLQPSEPENMSMTMIGKAVFPGNPNQVLVKDLPEVVLLEVRKSDLVNQYRISIIKIP